MVCKYCGAERIESDFEVANIIKGVVYRRKKCASCKGKDRLARVRRNAAWLRDYKMTQSCSHCSIDDHRVLEFHHVDGSKEVEVSSLTAYSIRKMQEEIAKCIVLCANCHKIEHWEERTQQKV